MRLKKIFWATNALIFVTALASTSMAQSIDEALIKDLRQNFAAEASNKAVQNAVSASSSIKTMALNRERVGKTDHYFKYKVDVKGITDQKKSGRCWMFTSLNVLRPSIIKKYGVKSFDFSHNYLYFYDILEKSNLFLQNIIRTSSKDMDDREVCLYFSDPVGDGGVWNLYFNVASKYGLVPAEVMPETEHSNNTAQLLSLVKERLRKGGMQIRNTTLSEAQEGFRKETLKDVYKILAICLGEPPTEFTWRYKGEGGEIKELKNYSPMQFYKEVVPAEYAPDNYVMIMHDPTRPYYEVYDISNYRNTYEGLNWKYLNLPIEDIKKAALASIKNNEPLYASCDVGKQLNINEGVLDCQMYDYASLFGVDFSMEKKDRILSRQSGSAHAMALVACDVDEKEKPIKWQFENSWGASSGHEGFLTLTDEWFEEYMFRIVINQKYLDSKAKKASKKEATILPPWDYMF